MSADMGKYKIFLLVQLSLNGLAPKYTADLLVQYKKARALRSCAKHSTDSYYAPHQKI